jgi:hypothetical protein
LNDKALRFHAQAYQKDDYYPWWEANTMITYNTYYLTDTHNAMNAEKGIFTAPFRGHYGFEFYAELKCSPTQMDLFADVKYTDVDHRIQYKIFTNTCSEKEYSSTSVYFALRLDQGDEIGIFTKFENVYLENHILTFTGFLLEKY